MWYGVLKKRGNVDRQAQREEKKNKAEKNILRCNGKNVSKLDDKISLPVTSKQDHWAL